jgi:hypothetical protein
VAADKLRTLSRTSCRFLAPCDKARAIQRALADPGEPELDIAVHLAGRIHHRRGGFEPGASVAAHEMAIISVSILGRAEPRAARRGSVEG